MRKVQCYECGKRYDFDVDDFCPKCGAFNQPQKDVRIGADGVPVRVDGINERNHQRSFVHAELHEENRERRAVGLSKGVKRAVRPAVPQTASRRQAGQSKQTPKGNPLNLVVWIVFAIIAINILGNLVLLFT